MDQGQLEWIEKNVFLMKNLCGRDGPGWQIIFQDHTRCEPFYRDGTLSQVVDEAMKRMAGKWPIGKAVVT